MNYIILFLLPTLMSVGIYMCVMCGYIFGFLLYDNVLQESRSLDSIYLVLYLFGFVCNILVCVSSTTAFLQFSY